MARPDLEERMRRSGMQKYLLGGERPIIADHQHWGKVAREIALLVVVVVLVLGLDTSLPASAGSVVNLLWIAVLVLFGWTAWKVALWRKNWFVATDKRMMLNHGLINVDVAMLSLTKVVDLTYTRSTMGRLLGYGTFVRESAGQHQSMREVKWVKKPEVNFNRLCAAIFSLEHPGADRGDQGRPAGGGSPPPWTPNPENPSPYVGFPPRPDGHRDGPDTIDQSTGIRTRPATAEPDNSDSWHPDPTSEPDISEADTGPISY